MIRRGRGRVADGVARVTIALRWLVVSGWIAATVASILYLPSLMEVTGAEIEGLVPTDSKAVQAERRSIEIFGFPLLSRTMVVQRDPQRLTGEAQARVFLRAAALTAGAELTPDRIVGALPISNALRIFPGSAEQSTTAVTYLFFHPETGLTERTELARGYADRVANIPQDAVVGATGAIPARIVQGRLIVDSLPIVEMATVVLIALIVGIHFRSVAAPILTLVSAGIAYLIAIHAIAWAGQWLGIGVPQELEPLIVVLLLGIVTDYSIFFLSSFRDRLARGLGKKEAAVAATAPLLPIIVAAGLAVAAGTAALVVARLEVFSALGPGMALTVLVGLLVAITFVPAGLALLGRFTFWPTEPEPSPERAPRGGSLRARLTYWATARPVAILIALLASAALAVPAIQAADMTLALTPVRGLPASTEVAQAAEAAQTGFAPGIISPSELLLQGPGALDLDRVYRLENLLETRPGIAAVIGPREAERIAERLDRLPEVGTIDPQRVRRLITQPVLSRDPPAARLMFVLDDPPLGATAIERLEELQDDMPGLLQRAGLGNLNFAFAGDTAIAAETIDRTVADLGRIAVAVLTVGVVLLALFLRALVAPIFLMGASVLGFAASLGLTTYLFQDVLGIDGLSYFVPFAAAVLLVSLGSDYNIFLVGRIWARARHEPLREAIAIATPQAGRAITIAGITLALSFSLLAIVPLESFREFAFAMFAGILIDTFIVRSFLVPALVATIGNASAWPGDFSGFRKRSRSTVRSEPR